MQVVNLGSNKLPLKISVDGVGKNFFESIGSKMTILTSNNVMDENSFNDPKKVYLSAILSLYLYTTNFVIKKISY